MTPSISNKRKNNKWNFIKIKNFISRVSGRKLKQPTEWENIFANHTPDIGLMYRI